MLLRAFPTPVRPPLAVPSPSPRSKGKGGAGSSMAGILGCLSVTGLAGLALVHSRVLLGDARAEVARLTTEAHNLANQYHHATVSHVRRCGARVVRMSTNMCVFVERA